MYKVMITYVLGGLKERLRVVRFRGIVTSREL